MLISVISLHWVLPLTLAAISLNCLSLDAQQALDKSFSCTCIYKNKDTSAWNYFLNSGLRKFRHGISIVERAGNLAGERLTLRAW